MWLEVTEVYISINFSLRTWYKSLAGGVRRDALNAPLFPGLDHMEVLGQGGGDALCCKLGLCLGKPSSDPAHPELGQLDDDSVTGGVDEGLTISRLGGQNQRARWQRDEVATDTARTDLAWRLHVESSKSCVFEKSKLGCHHL